jgi:alpha-glucoside transport system substrate-binding protein
MRRRDALRGLALLTLTAACGGPSESVRVVVLWSGWELKQFRRVLRGFPQRGRWQVSVQSEGNDLNLLLSNHAAQTATPDVALIQQPGMVARHKPPFAAHGYVAGVPLGWSKLLGGHGVWFKAAHKSIVWYREDRLPSAPPPADWDAWVELCSDMARGGRPPLAIGAADGWVLTDWFENALLSLSPDTYYSLAEGQNLWTSGSVRSALKAIGTVWQIPGVFPDGPHRALLTQYDGALVDVFARGRAAMVVGADFFYPIIEQVKNAPARWSRFPTLPGGGPPIMVAGDAAVLLNSRSQGGRDLIDWLASPEAATTWAGAGGFLSVNRQVRGYPGDLGELAVQIQTEAVGVSGHDSGLQRIARAKGPPFDLSDQLGGALGGDDGRGTWKIFQDFFADVAVRRMNLDDAVERTSRILAAKAAES